MTGRFFVHDQRVFQIVDRRGVKHFKGTLTKCACPHSGCTKLRFPCSEVATLYSKYRFMKYGEQLKVYWASDCGCYHLTTSKKAVWQWT